METVLIHRQAICITVRIMKQTYPSIQLSLWSQRIKHYGFKLKQLFIQDRLAKGVYAGFFRQKNYIGLSPINAHVWLS